MNVNLTRTNKLLTLSKLYFWGIKTNTKVKFVLLEFPRYIMCSGTEHGTNEKLFLGKKSNFLLVKVPSDVHKIVIYNLHVRVNK